MASTVSSYHFNMWPQNNTTQHYLIPCNAFSPRHFVTRLTIFGHKFTGASPKKGTIQLLLIRSQPSQSTISHTTQSLLSWVEHWSYCLHSNFTFAEKPCPFYQPALRVRTTTKPSFVVINNSLAPLPPKKLISTWHHTSHITKSPFPPPNTILATLSIPPPPFPPPNIIPATLQSFPLIHPTPY